MILFVYSIIGKNSENIYCDETDYTTNNNTHAATGSC